MRKIAQAPSFITGILQQCRTFLLCIIAAVSFSGYSLAGDAAITEVDIKPVGNGIYQVSVTIAHADTGWDHYADRWDVLDEAGNLLGSRVLAHPHVNEQPFTRSLRVEIPAGVMMVTIVASDSVHGDNKETVTAEIPKE